MYNSLSNHFEANSLKFSKIARISVAVYFFLLCFQQNQKYLIFFLFSPGKWSIDKFLLHKNGKVFFSGGKLRGSILQTSLFWESILTKKIIVLSRVLF